VSFTSITQQIFLPFEMFHELFFAFDKKCKDPELQTLQ